MAGRIVQHQGLSLLTLDLEPGTLFGFDNSDNSNPESLSFPFLIGLVGNVKRGSPSNSGLNLVFYPGVDRKEEFVLYPKGEVLGLYVPKLFKGKELRPHYRYMVPGTNYPVERGYSGIEEVTSGLRASGSQMEFYLDCLRDRRFVVDRGWLGKFLEDSRYAKYLPSRVRFTRNFLDRQL